MDQADIPALVQIGVRRSQEAWVRTSRRLRLPVRVKGAVRIPARRKGSVGNPWDHS